MINFLFSALGGVYGSLFTLGLSVGKEASDEYAYKDFAKHGWSWTDFCADLVGIVIGLTVHFLIKAIL